MHADIVSTSICGVCKNGLTRCQLRQRLKIEGSLLEDCAIHWFAGSVRPSEHAPRAYVADRLIHVATWWQCARCQEAQELKEAGYSGVVYQAHAPIEPQQPVPSEPGSEPAPVSAQRARLTQAAERAVIADRPATSRPLLQEPLLGEPGPPVGST